MSMKHLVAATSVAAALVAGTVVAGGPDLAPVKSAAQTYMTAELGYAHVFKAATKKKNTWNGRVAGGYMFNKTLGLEVGVASYLPIKVKDTDGKLVSSSKMPYVVDANVVGKYQINSDFFATAKLGLALVTIHDKVVSPASDATKVKLAPTAALTVGYNVDEDMAVTAGYRYVYKSFTKGKARTKAFGSPVIGLQWTL